MNGMWRSPLRRVATSGNPQDHTVTCVRWLAQRGRVKRMAECNPAEASSAIVRDCHVICNHISSAGYIIGPCGEICVHFCAKNDSRKSSVECEKSPGVQTDDKPQLLINNYSRSDWINEAKTSRVERRERNALQIFYQPVAGRGDHAFKPGRRHHVERLINGSHPFPAFCSPIPSPRTERT